MAFKTPKTILTHAKSDIEAGHWCKGSLAKFGKDDGSLISEEDMFTEIVADAEQEGRKVSFFDKPMGCALGLVSMYAGLGQSMTVIDEDGKKKKFFLPNYPRFSDGGGVEKALRALYSAIPVGDRRYTDALPTEDQVTESIHRYNDLKGLGPKKAAKWFERALASL